MVSFSCESCADVLPKKKLDAHTSRCRNAQFTCLDCQTTFHGTDYRAHTSCISEAQKYQKGLYRGDKGRGGSGRGQNSGNGRWGGNGRNGADGESGNPNLAPVAGGGRRLRELRESGSGNENGESTAEKEKGKGKMEDEKIVEKKIDDNRMKEGKSSEGKKDKKEKKEKKDKKEKKPKDKDDKKDKKRKRNNEDAEADGKPTTTNGTIATNGTTPTTNGTSVPSPKKTKLSSSSSSSIHDAFRGKVSSKPTNVNKILKKMAKDGTISGPPEEAMVELLKGLEVKKGEQGEVVLVFPQ